MSKLEVLVAGVPLACQDARPDGTWLTSAQKARIEAVSPAIRIHHPSAGAINSGRAELPSPHAILVEASGSEPSLEDIPFVLFGGPLRGLITPNLRFVQSVSAGVEHLLPVVPLDVPLCNASGVAAPAIAETIFAVILSRAKMLFQRRDDQEAALWRSLPCREIVGTRICVIGTGDIGIETARLAKAFGMKTVGVRRRPAPAAHFDRVFAVSDLDEALVDADYVVVACPLTPDTNGLLSRYELSRMPVGSFLINVARGAVVDEESLIDALESGHLGGAFVDTHVQEPLPPGHPFWKMPNVYVTPHDSHASQLMGDRHVDLFCQNLSRLVAGKSLVNVVDRARGY